MAATKLTTCRICESHCGLLVDVENNKVLKIGPDKSDPYSWRDFCIKAGRADKVLYHPHRIRVPMRRVGDRYVESSWEEAISDIASRLERIIARDSADAVAVYSGNPAAYNTTNMLFSSMFFNALGTRSRYFVTSIDNSPNMFALQEMIGIPWLNPIPDVDNCDYFLLLGMNPAVSALNWGYNVPDGWKRILDAKSSRNAQIVVVDPRKTESAAGASLHIAVKPGGDWAFLLGVIKVILDNGWEAADPQPCLRGLGVIRDLVATVPLPQLVEQSGVTEVQIRAVAQGFAQARTALCIGHTGLSMQTQGTVNLWLSHVLNAITNRFDKVGGRWGNSGISNWTELLSAGDGELPPSRVRKVLPIAGFYPVAILPEEITTPGSGQIKALFINAGNPVSSGPQSDALDTALQELELLVAVDLVQRESHRHAHWLIPGTHMFEREDFSPLKPGLTSEHLVSIDRQVVDPAPDLWSEWEFFLELGLKMNLPMLGKKTLNPLLRATRWLARVTGRRGLSITPRLIWSKMVKDGGVVAWRDIARTERRLPFSAPKIGALSKMIATPDHHINLAPEIIVAECRNLLRSDLVIGSDYPFCLLSRRARQGMNSWLWDTFEEKADWGEEIELNAEDAAVLGVSEGNRVVVTSASGSVVLRAVLSNKIGRGVTTAYFGFGSGVYEPATGQVAMRVGNNIHNRLSSNTRVDTLTGNAVFNNIPVRIEKVA